MATPSKKLIGSLEVLRALQDKGVIAIRTADLSRVHRERLVRSGFLQRVMKGWYIPSKPDDTAGESTAWYASFWGFCAAYFRERFGTDWCLSPERSLSLHAGNFTVPGQLLIRSPKGGNKVTKLPHGTSLLDVRSAMSDASEIEEKDGLRIFSLPAALVACSPRFFSQYAVDACSALSAVRDASEVLHLLLEGGHTTVAGRLAGAFRNIGRDRMADDIVETMRAADYAVRESDPFDAPAPLLLSTRETSPYVNRIRLMWRGMRGPIIERFPAAPGKTNDVEAYLERVREIYVTDAYHSLSIEGYRVSRNLIERVRSGEWNPDAREGDRDYHNALVARGYWEAHQAVRQSVGRVLQNDNPGSVVDEDHATWFREMFAPMVSVGLMRTSDLAGYRNRAVHIRDSMHAPPNYETVPDLMSTFFDLLQEEVEPGVRVVLGHFVFVYIHPYMDGNGRIGRFLMNVMLASGGYPWTVVPIEQRNDYMVALEEASVKQNIVPVTDLLGRLVEGGLQDRISAKAPA